MNLELHERPDWGFRETERQLIWDCGDIEATVHFVEIEPGRLMPFFHLEVFLEWSVPLFRKAKRRWATFLDEWKDYPLFTMADQDSEVLDRLREHFGFRFLTEIPCTDGKTRRLYVHYGP